MPDSTRRFRIAAMVCAGLAVLALATAVLNVPRTSRLVAGGRAEGKVVSVRRLGRTPHLVVRYESPDGDAVQFRSEVSRPRGIDIGDYVPVRYDPHDPDMAEVDTFEAIWGRVLIPAGVGVVLATLAVILFLRDLRSRRRLRARSRHRHAESVPLGR